MRNTRQVQMGRQAKSKPGILAPVVRHQAAELDNIIPLYAEHQEPIQPTGAIPQPLHLDLDHADRQAVGWAGFSQFIQ